MAFTYLLLSCIRQNFHCHKSSIFDINQMPFLSQNFNGKFSGMLLKKIVDCWRQGQQRFCSRHSKIVLFVRETERKKERKEYRGRIIVTEKERKSGKREIKGTVWVRIYRTTKPKDQVTERVCFFLSSINMITSDIFFQINLSFWWLKLKEVNRENKWMKKNEMGAGPADAIKLQFSTLFAPTLRRCQNLDLSILCLPRLPRLTERTISHFWNLMVTKKQNDIFF